MPDRRHLIFRNRPAVDSALTNGRIDTNPEKPHFSKSEAVKKPRLKILTRFGIKKFIV
jgi:hypothetical protein